MFKDLYKIECFRKSTEVLNRFGEMAFWEKLIKRMLSIISLPDRRVRSPRKIGWSNVWYTALKFLVFLKM